MKSRIHFSKPLSLFLSIALLLTTTLVANSTVRADVDSWFKAWTTVGSAGTIDEASTSKLVMSGAYINFPDILSPLPTDTFEPAERLSSAAVSAAAPLETVTATVRYNVVATDGLFENGAYLGMRARIRDDGDRAQVVLRLYETNIDTGVTLPVMTLNSDSFTPSNNYQTVGTSTFVGNRINFQQNAYYIEATLTKKQSALTPIGGGRPGIAVIQLQKFTPIL